MTIKTSGLVLALVLMVSLVGSVRQKIEADRLDRAVVAAANAGDDGRIRSLLREGGDPNVSGGWALLCAIESGSPPTVASLLRAGADPNTDHEKGGSALAWAVRKGDTRTIALLLKAGSRVDTEALCDAAAFTHPAAVRMLLKARGRVDGQLWDGSTALICAASARAPAFANAVKCTRLLLAHGAQVNVRDSEGRTPLMLAVETRNTAVVRLLLAHGADPNMKDNAGRTALARVGTHPSGEIARLLQEAGARE